MAKKTVERMVDKVARLYEQGADEQRIETYLNHWWRWVRSGVDGVSLFGFGLVVYMAFTQPTTETIAFGRVGWANDEGLAISSGFLTICPPYKSDRTLLFGFWNCIFFFLVFSSRCIMCTVYYDEPERSEVIRPFPC
ncbi:MAG: hypothetical protein F6K63_31745 [Moorea sp. SIO1G6]|uniref:hypothetical protein n=1 Tax=Moorena sp. SIO1G6 TaxID=2607840 RepID=UPI0013C0A43E|nr:hypothetical protein [Moorena sp. SIO1G6]NET68722.1 hypothetical protein [Moorena sp. SIO1G6]